MDVDQLEIGRELLNGEGDDASILFEEEQMNLKFPNESKLYIDGTVVGQNKIITGDGSSKPIVISISDVIDIFISERTYQNEIAAGAVLGSGKAFWSLDNSGIEITP